MGKFKDLVGTRFGFWLVKSLGEKSSHGKIQWLCECECGTERLVESSSLRSYNSTSCGCNHNPNFINVVFGKLTVVEKIVDKHNYRRHWLCKCECGNLITLTTNQLKNLNFTSCKDCKIHNDDSSDKIISQIETLLVNLKLLYKNK
jgi:hypothetical protein